MGVGNGTAGVAWRALWTRIVSDWRLQAFSETMSEPTTIAGAKSRPDFPKPTRVNR